MSRFSENFKNMMKTDLTENVPYKCCHPKVSQYNNNNNANISSKMRQSNIITNTTNQGKVQYGNFGSFIDATVANNIVLEDLNQILIDNAENNNYTYVSNVISSLSDPCLLSPSTTKEVNYNQFYNAYFNLNSTLMSQNINSGYILNKNKF